MKVGMLGCVGLFLGAIFGGAIGVGIGMIWIKCFTPATLKAIPAC